MFGALALLRNTPLCFGQGSYLYSLTKDKLHYLDINRNCALCEEKAEMGYHLFFECSLSSIVWWNIRHWPGIKIFMSTIAIFLKWIKKEARGTSWRSEAKRIALMSTVYYLWLTRNRKIFEYLLLEIYAIGKMEMKIKEQKFKKMEINKENKPIWKAQTRK